MKKKSTYIALLTCLLAGFVYYNSNNKENSQVNDLEKNVEDLVVVTVQPKLVNIPSFVSTIATLNSYEDVEVINGTPGLLSEKIVKPGELVEKGQKIAKLKPDAYVIAAINGVFVDWRVSVGNYLEQGQKLGRIVDDSKLMVSYTLPESYLSKVKVGQEVGIESKVFPGKIFKGKVSYVSPVVDKANHQLSLRAVVDNSEGKLASGLFVKVKQSLGHVPEAIVIPETVVIRDVTSDYLYIVNNGKVNKKNVTLGVEYDDRIQVVSGINKDDEIVLVIPPGIWNSEGEVKTRAWDGDW